MQWARGLLTVAFMASSFLTVARLSAAEPDKKAQTPATKEEEYYELMRVLADTVDQIERNYVKEIDRRALVEAALHGMMEQLDQYSNYINPDDLSRFNAIVEQEFGGIGIQVAIDQKTHRLTVMTPLPGTPAYKAGIRAGDTIMEIEGKSTEGFTLDQAVKLLKGKAGDAVTISVLHVGNGKVEKLTMTRALIHVSTVLGDKHKPDETWDYMLDNEKKIGYLRLTAFSRDSTRELKEALNELKKEGMKALILDLRFNPGGLLTAATEISDLFIDDGKIVSTRGRNTPEKVWNASKKGTFSGFPMVVLVNHFSASASEIVSAALQDHHRAVIIGERTWGKGSVQNVIELESGKSALKLTTASYHRPSGKNIHRFPGAKDSDEWGVMPDESYSIPFTHDETEKYQLYRQSRDTVLQDKTNPATFNDRQLAKAVEYLVGELSGEKKPAKTDDAKKEDAAKDAAKKDEKPASEKKPDEKKPDEKGTEKSPEKSDKAPEKPAEKKPDPKTSRLLPQDGMRKIRTLRPAEGPRMMPSFLFPAFS